MIEIWENVTIEAKTMVCSEKYSVNLVKMNGLTIFPTNKKGAHQKWVNVVMGILKCPCTFYNNIVMLEIISVSDVAGK